MRWAYFTLGHVAGIVSEGSLEQEESPVRSLSCRLDSCRFTQVDNTFSLQSGPGVLLASQWDVVSRGKLRLCTRGQPQSRVLLPLPAHVAWGGREEIQLALLGYRIDVNVLELVDARPLQVSDPLQGRGSSWLYIGSL